MKVTAEKEGKQQKKKNWKKRKEIRQKTRR